MTSQIGRCLVPVRARAPHELLIGPLSHGLDDDVAVVAHSGVGRLERMLDEPLAEPVT